MDFLIGGLAGAGATIFTNPMDVVKTRMQLQGELKSRKEQATKYRGMVHALFVIARTDGPMALQKGLAPAMLFGFSMNSVRLGTYHVAEMQGWTKHKNGDVSFPKAVFWSSVSGILSGVTGNPASVLKTRMQATAHPSIAVGRQHRYKGMWDGCQTIFRNEGLRGLFAGVNGTCIRLAIGSAAQLTTFSLVKESLLVRGYFVQSPVTLACVSSVLSGLIVLFLETPLDLANTRLYNQGPASGGLLYNGVVDCLTKIYRTEGLHGLYKGLGPLYFRLAPHTTLSLVIWDMLNNLLTQSRNKTN